MYMGFIWAAQ